MKKSEFKQLIKESVREVLVTEGFLSTIVAEVVKGVGTNVLTYRVVEKKVPQETPKQSAKFQEERAEQKRKQLQETRKRMLEFELTPESKDSIDAIKNIEKDFSIKTDNSDVISAINRLNTSIKELKERPVEIENNVAVT